MSSGSSVNYYSMVPAYEHKLLRPSNAPPVLTGLISKRLQSKKPRSWCRPAFNMCYGSFGLTLRKDNISGSRLGKESLEQTTSSSIFFWSLCYEGKCEGRNHIKQRNTVEHKASIVHIAVFHEGGVKDRDYFCIQLRTR